MYVYVVLQTFMSINYSIDYTEVIGIYSSEEKALNKLGEILGVKSDELKTDCCYHRYTRNYNDVYTEAQTHKLDED